MTHARTTVRNAVATLLTDAGIASGRVYTGRRRALPSNQFPMVIVQGDSETSTQDEHGGLYVRTYRLEVICMVRNVTGADDGSEEDAADALAAAVETVMIADAVTGAHSLELISSQFRHYTEGDANFTALQLTYSLVFLTEEGAPATPV